MNSGVATVVVEDPGPGGRLDATNRQKLREVLKARSRDGSRSLLLSIGGDAWHHAPEVAGYDEDHLAQATVSADPQALVTELFRLPIPVIVGLHGRVSGLGFALALAADIRVASPDTTFSLGDPQTCAALLGGSTWLLAHTMDRGTLAHLVWTGAELTASSAAAQRLVSEVATDDAVARRLAERLAGLPKQTASALKRALVSHHKPDLAAVLEYESWLVGVAAQGGD